MESPRTESERHADDSSQDGTAFLVAVLESIICCW